ncbi:SAM domain (Sterile alpha motif) [Fragilaria crotonensis]|nr:SAM domain (Sterile alpha motif) [Fragilaria crotonensis]
MTISIKDFDNHEVCIWLNAIGLGSKIEPFRESAVDGDLLCSLTLDDLTGDLGLSGLQAKKVLRGIEAETHAGSNHVDSSQAEEIAQLEVQNAQLEKQIAELRARIERMNQAPAPAAYSPPPPQQHHSHSPPPQQHHQQQEYHQRRGPGVIGGAARGAAGGAVKGAIAGAILPGMSAADGAAAGAAVGATTGGVRGLRRRLG